MPDYQAQTGTQAMNSDQSSSITEARSQAEKIRMHRGPTARDETHLDQVESLENSGGRSKEGCGSLLLFFYLWILIHEHIRDTPPTNLFHCRCDFFRCRSCVVVLCAY